MVDRSRVLALIKGATPQTQEEAPLPQIAQQSPLTAGERGSLAILDNPEKKMQLLEKFGYKKENILRPENSPTGDFAIMGKSGVVYPVDVKGKFEAGDITETLPSIAKGIGSTLGSLGGAAAGSLAGPGGTVAGGIAGGAGGAALTDIGLQKLAGLEGMDWGQTGREALTGGISSALPGASNLVSAAAGKQTMKQALKEMAAAQLWKQPLGKSAAKSLEQSSKMINIVDPLKGELNERTLKDVVGNKYVRDRTQSMMTEEADTIAGRAASKVLDFFDKRMKPITEKMYSMVPDTQAVKVTKPLSEISEIVSRVKATGTSGQVKGIAKLEKSLNEMAEDAVSSAKGAIPFSKLKAHIADLYETAQKLKGSGNNTIARHYDEAANALRAARDNIKVLKKATGKFKNIKKVEEFFHDLMRVGPNEQSIKPEVMLQTKIQTMAKNDGFRSKLHEMWRIMNKTPELKPYANMIDEMKLAQVATDIKTAKNVKPTGNWINRVPVLKEMANVNPFTNPEEGMRMLAAQSKMGIIKPTALEGQIERSNIPFIGRGLTRAKAQAAMYGKGAIAPTPTGLTAGMMGQLGRMIGKSAPRQVQMPVFRQLMLSLPKPSPRPGTQSQVPASPMA